MKLHAILPPSAAARWLTCTPSARFEEQIPEVNTDYSEEGTLAHDLAALVLSLRSGNFIGSQELFNTLFREIERKVFIFYKSGGYDSDECARMFKSMYEYAEKWAELITFNEGTIYIEKRLEMEAYAKLCYGTTDAMNIDGYTLYISDYKYGAGVRVGATGNKQMMIYGLGGLSFARSLGHEIKKVVLMIYQPRAGGVSSWELTAEELHDWGMNVVSPNAVLAAGGQGDFIAGDHCQFCKAKTVCTAFYNKFASIRRLQDKRTMTPDQVAEVLTHGAAVRSWIEKVEKEAVTNLKNGIPVKGFKLVNGRGNRQFTSEADVIDALIGYGLSHDKVFKTSLRSLTDLENELGPKLFAAELGAFIIKPQGAPKLAPADDERPAVDRLSSADDYD